MIPDWNRVLTPEEWEEASQGYLRSLIAEANGNPDLIFAEGKDRATYSADKLRADKKALVKVQGRSPVARLRGLVEWWIPVLRNSVERGDIPRGDTDYDKNTLLHLHRIRVCLAEKFYDQAVDLFQELGENPDRFGPLPDDLTPASLLWADLDYIRSGNEP